MSMKYLLSSFEPENAYAVREVILERKISCGERDDYFIAHVIPPLEGILFGHHADIETVIIAPRHKGIVIEDTNQWPVHVYVCVLKNDELLLTTFVKPVDLKIINWGLLDRLCE